ncbi:NAD-dependent epimerase/dehydratase family protein [Aquirufa ecclesiirivi]|uniref:NAD-dependent epimerase/dehydratase family protein n=1 Tax=Aquirufa ecclesiirivi TaxID=2715124 RepID=UPI001407B69D|nr:NAD-dependent epimerase/dehydratase family protein [Aquirufa ecclesiirivi]NHC47884.1 NAD-dependent epimerase/dehydratase family protein [Aquirufa ecclesiirivi]
MKILITGGCGFVGSNLAALFKQHLVDCEVYCLDNLSRRGSELNLNKILPLGVKFVHGDVRIKTDFDRIPHVDVVIDAAAEPSVLAGSQAGELEYLIDTNLNGTINTLYFAKKHQAAFIFLSTSRVYPYNSLSNINFQTEEKRFVLSHQQAYEGLSEKGVAENFPLAGLRSLYGATKLSSEYIIQEFAHNFGIPTVINRCGVLSGPYQMGKIDQGVIVLWMAKHFWNKSLSYIGFGGNGQQIRDVLHVKDLFRLVLWQIQHLDLHQGQIFNVGGGLENSVSLAELTNLCVQITGNTIPISSSSENRPGDLPIYITDNSRITAFSQWKPEISVPTLLGEVHDWFIQDQAFLKPILS